MCRQARRFYDAKTPKDANVAAAKARHLKMVMNFIAFIKHGAPYFPVDMPAPNHWATYRLHGELDVKLLRFGNDEYHIHSIRIVAYDNIR